MLRGLSNIECLVGVIEGNLIIELKVCKCTILYVSGLKKI
jgi:hypothetical protein